MFRIISDGIPIGHFQSKEDAQEALVLHVKSGFVQEVNDFESRV